MATRLKQEALDFLRNHDVDLYVPISQALNIKVGSIGAHISRNSRRLTEYAALIILANHMGKQPNDLVEEYDETEPLTVATK